MTRPLLNFQIVDLERLFETSKGDAQVLAQLEHELRHRKSKRAGLLLEKINQHRQQRSQGDGWHRGESRRSGQEHEPRRRAEQPPAHHEPVHEVVRRWLKQPQGWRYVFEMHGHVTLDAVKVVYRKLAFQLHPDRGGDPELMKLVNHAMDLAREDLRR